MTWLEKMIAAAAALGSCELGALVRLAVASRQPAGLPDDDRVLARVAGCDPAAWGAMRVTVQRYFSVTPAGSALEGFGPPRLDPEALARRRAQTRERVRRHRARRDAEYQRLVDQRAMLLPLPGGVVVHGEAAGPQGPAARDSCASVTQRYQEREERVS